MDAIAAEKLKEIAQTLIQARQAQGISLEEISTKTYIPLRLLKAIEEGEAYKLPEPVFVQGFLKRYADLIGLDGTAIAQSFPTPSPNSTALRSIPLSQPNGGVPAPMRSSGAAATQIPKTTVPPAPTTPNLPDPDLPEWESPPRPRWALPLAIGMGTLLIGSVVLAGINQRPQTAQKSPAPEKPAEVKNNTAPTGTAPSPVPSVLPSPIAPSAPAATIVPSPQASPSPTANPPGAVTVSLDVTEESWVELEVDGKIMTSETLTKGTKKTVSGKNIVVATGNARGVKVSYNQGMAKSMGSTADVAELKFPPVNTP